jgi:phosphohistidine phosphatase
MAIYLVQHGIALSKDVDPERSLSDEGRCDVEAVAAQLADSDLMIGKIYHSGKTRAEQTAQVFSKLLGSGDTIKVDGMSPNDDVIAFSASLEDGAMYIGHLPHMEKLLSYLTTGNENSGVLKFTNGGVVCVDLDCKQVLWCLVPGIC